MLFGDSQGKMCDSKARGQMSSNVCMFMFLITTALPSAVFIDKRNDDLVLKMISDIST